MAKRTSTAARAISILPVSRKVETSTLPLSLLIHWLLSRISKAPKIAQMKFRMKIARTSAMFWLTTFAQNQGLDCVWAWGYEAVSNSTYRIISHSTEPELEPTESNVFPSHAIKTLSRVCFDVECFYNGGDVVVQEHVALSGVLISDGCLNAYNDYSLKRS